MNKSALLKVLGWEDPWQSFDSQQVPHLWGWGSSEETAPFLAQLVQWIHPALLIEVGTWLGASAVDLVKACQAQRLDSCLLCVDTWLGSLEHWLNPEYRNHLHLQQGYPHYYPLFLANLYHAQVANQVIPVPLPSTIAARLLQHHQIQADLIYVDGSHEPQDVWLDLQAYWPLLRAGGVLAGDDWGWPGVADVLEQFCRSQHVHVEITGLHWVIKK